MKTIVRYKNRKLYDPDIKGYVKLENIQQMAKQGLDFKVIDHVTKDDITYQTLLTVLYKKLTNTQSLNKKALVELISKEVNNGY